MPEDTRAEDQPPLESPRPDSVSSDQSPHQPRSLSSPHPPSPEATDPMADEEDTHGRKGILSLKSIMNHLTRTANAFDGALSSSELVL